MATFLDDVPIEGVADFEVTDEVRWTIAATAARLALHLDPHVYAELPAVYVYPGDALVQPGTGDEVFGAAHHQTAIVLAWDAVVRGLTDPDDGRDTLLHEFVHVLDFASGSANGAPVLRARAHYAAWAAVLGRHFEAQREGAGVLRPYAGTNPAEFFACATEVFFEQPQRLAEAAPDLHAELARFYGWVPPQVR